MGHSRPEQVIVHVKVVSIERNEFLVATIKNCILVLPESARKMRSGTPVNLTKDPKKKKVSLGQGRDSPSSKDSRITPKSTATYALP